MACAGRSKITHQKGGRVGEASRSLPPRESNEVAQLFAWLKRRIERVCSAPLSGLRSVEGSRPSRLDYHGAHDGQSESPQASEKEEGRRKEDETNRHACKHQTNAAG